MPIDGLAARERWRYTVGVARGKQNSEGVGHVDKKAMLDDAILSAVN
jgi:hypothetical protein